MVAATVLLIRPPHGPFVEPSSHGLLSFRSPISLYDTLMYPIQRCIDPEELLLICTSEALLSTLLYALGRWSYRHPWRVLIAWLLLLGIAGGSAAVFMKGTDNAFSIPGTESQAGIQQLNRSFPQASGTAAQIIVVADEGDQVRDEPYSSVIDDTIASIEDLDGVLAVTDPFNEMVTGLVSDDGAAAIIRLQFDGQATDVSPETKTALKDIGTDFEDSLPAGSQVAVGGDLFSQSVPAISIIEAVGVLIALFVLIVTFRSFAMAWFPLASAIIGVALAVSLIFVATAFASISSTTPLLAIMLGLAVGIDYALFIAARHQDQVRAGVPPEESAARANGTAGSAVVFAGVTVLIALIGLSFANIPFLTTMGIAASVAVAIAVLVALTLTPAFLGFAKGRVVGWRRRPRRASRARHDAAAPKAGFAQKWVGGVTRHPIITTVAVVVGLGILAIPAASLQLALPNAGMQAHASEARQAYDLTSEHFGPGFNGPLIMTGTIVTSTDPLGLMEDLATEIEEIPGVKTVALATPNETADTGIIQIVPETAPDDPATAELVRELRAQHDRLLDDYGVDLKVTGFTAVAIDISDRLGGALVPFGIFVVGLSLILLTMVFRSIWVPIKAALGYLLSVAAAFGVVAAVFEWGWLAEPLHVDKVGPDHQLHADHPDGRPVRPGDGLRGVPGLPDAGGLRPRPRSRRRRRRSRARRLDRAVGVHGLGQGRHGRRHHHVRGVRRVRPRGRRLSQADRTGPRGRHPDRRLRRAHDARTRRHGSPRREGMVDAALARPGAPPLRHRRRGGRARARPRELARARDDRRRGGRGPGARRRRRGPLPRRRVCGSSAASRSSSPPPIRAPHARCC